MSGRTPHPAPTEHENTLLGDGLAAVEGRVSGSTRFSGSRFVSRWLKTDVHEASVDLPVSERAALARAGSVLHQNGRVVTHPSVLPDQRQAVVEGGGGGGLNPVVVTLTCRSAGLDVTTVHVRAVAKEGLITQRSADGVVKKVSAALMQ